MTRIVLLLDNQFPATLICEDPRAPRDVMAAINSGSLRVGGADRITDRKPLWAMAHPSVNVVTVVLAAPPVQLGERHYKILFGLADGKTLKAVATAQGISLRSAEIYLYELKQRLRARSAEEVLARAADFGLLGG